MDQAVDAVVEQVYPERCEDGYRYLRPVIRETVYKYLNCGGVLLAVPQAQPKLEVCVHTYGDAAIYHPHLRVMASDGAFTPDGVFHALPTMSLAPDGETLPAPRVLDAHEEGPDQRRTVEADGILGENILSATTRTIRVCNEVGDALLVFVGPFPGDDALTYLCLLG